MRVSVRLGADRVLIRLDGAPDLSPGALIPNDFHTCDLAAFDCKFSLVGSLLRDGRHDIGTRCEDVRREGADAFLYDFSLGRRDGPLDAGMGFTAGSVDKLEGDGCGRVGDRRDREFSGFDFNVGVNARVGVPVPRDQAINSGIQPDDQVGLRVRNNDFSLT